MPLRGPDRLVIGLVLLLSACNSDRPEPAEMELPGAGLRLTLTRVATHPFLARYRVILQVDGSGGCTAAAELFPDTGYAGRRNLYLQASGAITVLGQYDARVIDRDGCSIRLVEFSSLNGEARFIGAFDVDAQNRWRYFPSSIRAEQVFETQ
ncbi:MAG: uncharacterized protein K0S45_98 [Nitrospira sp.]|nr:uncharacterized protein [Nitrospira sp.]